MGENCESASPPSKRSRQQESRTPDFEKETTKAIYDNFVAKGYSEHECNIARNTEGKTIRDDVREAIGLHHADKKKNKLGAKIYGEIKARHPRNEDGLPQPVAGEVIRPDLYRANHANV